MAQLRVEGPYGGQKEGQEWNDGFHKGIKEIELYFDSKLIHSIQVMYVNDEGEKEPGPRHGGSGGNEHHKVTLDPSKETDKLTKVIAYSSYSGSEKVITCLEFHTADKKTYGPYGHKEGPKYTFPISNGYIVGFFGRAGTYLNAIGGNVEVKPN